MGQEPYWYVDYVGFEQKQKRTNDLILGFRYWSPEGTKKRQVFVNQNVKIPTKLIHRDNKEKLTEIAEFWRDNKKLNKHKLTVQLSEKDAGYIDDLKKKYPGMDIQTRGGNFDVFQLSVPYNRELISELSNDFQTGNFDRNFRFDNDLLYKKVIFDPADELQFFFNNTGVVLPSKDSIKLCSERINSSEFRNQVWFYADIEKPLFKSFEEKRDIDRREYFLKLKAGKRKKFREKLEQLVSAEKDREKIDSQIGRIVGHLEKRLTKEIGGYSVKLWEEQYDAKISWYTFILKKADGSELRQLHTIRDSGLSEVDGHDIILHKTEKGLLNAVNKTMKDNNVAVFCNHNLPYDVTQTRFAAEETGANGFDLFIDNVFPRRDVVRKVYQRMKKDIEYIDPYRHAVNFHPWLENKKLQTFAQDRLGEESFEKSLTYAEMRVLEVKAIHGDKEAAKLLAHYAAGDVEPVKKIVEEGSYLETIFKIREMFPFLTITELAFSPRVVKKYFDWKHWKKNGNNRHFGYNRKIREDEEQIFKKRFGPLKREYMSDWAFDVPNIGGIHNDVLQAYIPVEYWLKDVICKVEKKWGEYYGSLSEDPIERFGQLRYPRDFSSEFLMDHYFAVNEKKRFKRRIRELPLDESKIDEVLDDFENKADKENLNKYIASLNNLRNQYRSIYVKLDAESRKIIRVPKKFSGGSNLFFDFVEFFARDNADLIALRKNADELGKRLDYNKQRELKRFLGNFETYYEKSGELLEYAKTGIKGLTPENIVYFSALRGASKKKAERFGYEYKITIDDVTTALRDGYNSLRDELIERKTRALCHKGDYLFLKGGNLNELKTLIPIRNLERFSVNSIKDEPDSGELF